MKVLHVIDGLGTGGAERSLAESLPALEDRGIRSVVAVRERRPLGVEATLTSTVDVRFLPRRLFQQARALRRLIRDEQPDVVHTTLFGATMLGRVCARGTGVPVLTSLVNTPYEKIRVASDPNISGWRLGAVRVVDRWSTRWTYHFHAITRAVADAAHEHLRIDARRITVIERGRDAGRLGEPSPERRRTSRAQLGLADDAHVVVCVGRQEYQKGHLHLLEAAELVCRADDRAVFLLAGRDGNASGALGQRLARMQHRDRVRFLGHSDVVGDVLVAADVFAFPSLWEGLGGSLIEAMSLGLPIVASDAPAIAETVAAGENAVLVAPGDARALSAAILELLDDDERRAVFGRASRARYESRFTLARMVDRTAVLYRQVAGRELDVDA